MKRLSISLLSSSLLAQHVDVSEWLSSQVPFSYDFILKNISPEGTLPGTVVASTSKEDPPCMTAIDLDWFHWVRDSAITMYALVDKFVEATGSEENELEGILRDYANLTAYHQTSPGKCAVIVPEICEAIGTPGEPKYYVNGSIYQPKWTRLQNDGPALRASTLMHFVNALERKGLDTSDIVLVIKSDLKHVLDYWGIKGYDLWEEVNAFHFYTRMVQRRALLEASTASYFSAEEQYLYKKAAFHLERQLEMHWNKEAGFIQEMLETPPTLKRSHLNAGTILAVLHSRNADSFFGPTDDRVLMTAMELQRSFADIYPINQVRVTSNGLPLGHAIGRYPEGDPTGHLGNPWILTTLAIAELYYRAIGVIMDQGCVEVNEQNLRFYQSIGIDFSKVGNSCAKKAVENVVVGMFDAAEALVRRVYHHVGDSPHLAEQFNRFKGNAESAKDLTWSYLSVLTTEQARRLVLKR